MVKRQSFFIILAAVCCLVFPACSINRMVIRAVSNALTAEGSSYVFTSDSDPQLVGDALPFAIKMYESLLAANPNHQGLLFTTGSLFVMYANAFVQAPAEQLPRWMFAERQAGRERAKRLYMRGLELLYRGLELRHPGFDSAFQRGVLPEILARMRKEDVPSLYWAAVAGLSAFSVDLSDTRLSMRISEFYALINRAYQLDPYFNSGALDNFLLIFYASLPPDMGGNAARAEIHFRRALEKSRGLLAVPFVSYARTVSIPAQDYDTFRAYLEAALAIDPDADPPNRLMNILAQREARFLLGSASQFFFGIGTDDAWYYDYWDYEDW